MKNSIQPTIIQQSFRTGRLVEMTFEEIVEALNGMLPNVETCDKTEDEWDFICNGKRCAIWDYKGSHRYGQYSVYDPHGALNAVFRDERYIQER